MNKCIAHSGYLCPLRHPTYNTEMCSYCNDYIKKDDNVEKNCSKCDNSRKRHLNEGRCKVLANCDSNNSGWKLRRDYNQENKEQEMSYKPTNKCCLKNIADELSKHGCYESKSEFFDFLIETRDGYSCTVESCWNFEGNSELTRLLTKTEKRRNWLLKFGYIEEEISLKPCPFCGGRAKLVSNQDNSGIYKRRVTCVEVGCTGSTEEDNIKELFYLSEKEVINKWNTRK